MCCFRTCDYVGECEANDIKKPCLLVDITSQDMNSLC